ncbi:MAG: outer membrane lipoprotein-sorting protein [Treponema sp.]|nr:outer membrane lipoprotein-sorting protein [Candidatus Treponema equifaecale]
MKLTKTLTAAVLMLSSAAFALDGREVIQKVLDEKDPSFSQTQVVMELIEKNGQKDVRNIIEYGRDVNGLKSIVMDFVGPGTSKVKGTRFLLQENEGNKDDDKFIYLPELKTTRRVSTADGSKSFVGTDASYDDLSTRDIDLDTHELLSENEPMNGYNCYKVKSTAKKASDSQYGYKVQWIDREKNIPVYAEMYDKKGKLEKTLKVEKLEVVKSEDGKNSYNTPMVTLMENVQTGHKTRLSIMKIVVDKPLPAGVFTQSFLNTGKIAK